MISDSMLLVSISAERAAAQVLDACRHGDPELVITWPAKLAIMANGVPKPSRSALKKLLIADC